MGFAVATLNSMLDAEFVTGDLVALHSADPGGTGANEVTGGGYARQAVAYDAASGGVKLLTGTETFSVPAGTVSHFTVFASNGTTVKADGALSASEVYAGAGTYDLTEITLTLT